MTLPTSARLLAASTLSGMLWLPDPVQAQAQKANDLTGVFQNLLGHAQPALLALTGIGFAVGFAFVIAAIANFKKYGLSSAGMLGPVTLKNPIISAVAGILMLWLSYAAGIGGQSIFGIGAQPNTITGSSTVIVQ